MDYLYNELEFSAKNIPTNFYMYLPVQSAMGSMWHRVKFWAKWAGLNSVFIFDWLPNLPFCLSMV